MSDPFDQFKFDPVSIKAKYDAERDKRLKMRPEGEAQYQRMEGAFEHYAIDPYMPVKAREPQQRNVEVLIAGGGFAGLLAAGRLRDQGIDDLLIIERAGDFGGTWYWNRYPGAACDVESYIYLPMLEETGTIPSAKYVGSPEILKHVRTLARHYDLYPRALHHTVATTAKWDEDISRWIVKTDRGDEICAKYLILASGHYRLPKLPTLEGMEKFKGHSFHTSRWDYDYTGGDPDIPMVNLDDKVVGIIGTGATAIQCVPPLGETAKHLYVFQRTPSSVDFRGNRPTDLDWFKSQKPGWQRERMDNFMMAIAGVAEFDLVDDGWTRSIHQYMQRAASATMTPEERGRYAMMANYALMENVRKRVDELVTDPSDREALKPWYDWLCKRPCFHDQYLQTFNRPNVTLVDTEGRGVERLTEDGVVANGQEYKVDCLIYASGFEVAAYEQGTPFPISGRGGLDLADKWKDGATTMHGLHVHGFPNFFQLTSRGSAQSSNFTHPYEGIATNIAYVVRQAEDRGAETVEVTAEAEAEWVRHHEELSVPTQKTWAECTPSYFNQEGKVTSRMLRDGTYGGGVLGLLEVMTAWRARGDLQGLKLTSKAKVAG
jgi:cyclohexanone monooxygenase